MAKKAMLEKAVLESSSDSESEESFLYGVVPSTSGATDATPPPKRGRRTVVSPELAAMCDRTGVSDRTTTMVLLEASRALGHNPQELALNRSTVQRHRQNYRKTMASSIKEAFKPTTSLTVHWDSKLMPDLTGINKVDRLLIIVTTMGDEQLLAIPKINAATGQAQAQAVNDTIREWEVENLVRAMCFDTTSSNTGRFSGACTILEQLLDKKLLRLGCRHHILELVLAAAFGECLGTSKAPEIVLFQRFQKQWPCVDKTKFENASSDDIAESALANVRDEILAFCEQQLLDYQPRHDYRELLNLMMVFLGAPTQNIEFQSPGPQHHARWMAKAVYSIKVWLFRSQFLLTARESTGLRDLNIFIAKVYLKFWYQAPIASKAARNDLLLLQQLDAYPQRSISTVTSRKIAGQLWYLSEVLVLLSLFDRDVDLATKRAMFQASLEKEGEFELLKRAVVDMAIVQQKTLLDFVSKRSRDLFSILGIPAKFLEEDPTA